LPAGRPAKCSLKARGYMLAIRSQERALTVLPKPEADAGLIFSQMERVVDSPQ